MLEPQAQLKPDASPVFSVYAFWLLLAHRDSILYHTDHTPSYHTRHSVQKAFTDTQSQRRETRDAPPTDRTGSRPALIECAGAGAVYECTTARGPSLKVTVPVVRYRTVERLLAGLLSLNRKKEKSNRGGGKGAKRE